MKMTPFITIFLLAFSCAVNASIPVPGHIIYGVVGIEGEPLGAGDSNVTLNVSVNGNVLASYTMGENPSIADRYILRVPMDTLSPPDPYAAREGDTAFISILKNGVESFQTAVTIGASGTVVVLNLGGVGDHDLDGIPDGNDPDRDNDGIYNADDSCPTGITGWTSDSTTDSDADGCRDSDEDLDGDNDNFLNDLDNCPWVSNSDQLNFDDDALGDACDPDDDNDGYDDVLELESGTNPLDANDIPSTSTPRSRLLNIILIKAALDARATLDAQVEQ
jgi:hypothetical protein